MNIPVIRISGGADRTPKGAPENSSSRRQRRPWDLSLWPILALLVYTLSIGPAAVHGQKMGLTDHQLEIIYAPLCWIIKRSDLGKNLFLWYAELWGWEGIPYK